MGMGGMGVRILNKKRSSGVQNDIRRLLPAAFWADNAGGGRVAGKSAWDVLGDLNSEQTAKGSAVQGFSKKGQHIMCQFQRPFWSSWTSASFWVSTIVVGCTKFGCSFLANPLRK